MNTGHVLLDILVLLVAAKVAAELAERVRLPAVLGEINAVMFGLVYGFFRLQNKLTKGGIRSDELDEIVGLDLPEMGVLAYPEFDLVKDDLAKKSESKVPASV